MPPGLAPILIIGVLPSAATLLGGSLALRIRTLLPVLLGFSGGAVIGVALFDLLPEALNLGTPFYQPLILTTALAGGFAVNLVLDRFVRGRAELSRHLGPFGLSLHSFMDGISIGLAFQVSSAVAIAVLIAVISHDLVDGVNTVTLCFAGGGGSLAARRWLVIDAAAPLFGMALATMIAIPATGLSLLLAALSGGFIYLGASKLLPQSDVGRWRTATSGATAIGLLFMYAMTRFGVH